MSAVRATRQGAILLLELNAPERRNALSRPMLARLAEHLREPAEGVLGVVLAGRGGTFSAGADFREISGTVDDLGYDDAVTAAREAIQSSPLPVVAAIEGPCMGAAADLALACDFRVAAEGGFVAIPAAGLGLLYNPDVVVRLARTFDADVLRRLLLLGQRLSAEEALRRGLVTEVVPAGSAARRAAELLGGLSAGSAPAVAATKALLNACTGGPPAAEHWQALRRDLLGSPERRHAVERARDRHA